MRNLIYILSLLFLVSCSSEKFLQEGETVLSNVKVESDSKEVNASSMRRLVRQEPNARWFGCLKVPLGIYCMSSADSVRASRPFQKMLRRVGEAPAVYDSTMTHYSLITFDNKLRSEGYLHATSSYATAREGHKTKLLYTLHPGERYYYEQIGHQCVSAADGTPLCTDASLQEALSTNDVRRGLPLRYEPLDALRSSLVTNLRNRGFYGINREFISYRVDTASYTRGVDLTLRIQPPAGVDSLRALSPWKIGKVRIFEGITPHEATDSVTYRGMQIFTSSKNKLHKRVYGQNVALRPDSTFSDAHVTATYAHLDALPYISYTTLTARERDTTQCIVDYDIMVHPAKPRSVAFEIEGTNTAGDLGAAASLTYSNRNFFHGSELLSLKLRGAYEAIRGLEGYSASNYIEYSAEAALRFPNLLVPRRKNNRFAATRGSSEVSLLFNSQDRPEFHRRVLTAAWTYRWNNPLRPRLSHKFEPISLNYIYMPWISSTFRHDYLEGSDPHYSVLRYSYEDLFIMNLRYALTIGSKHASDANASHQSDYQLRFAVETAGNALYGISKLAHSERDPVTGSYKALWIAYSQYVKMDFDYARTWRTSNRSSLAAHVALGIAQPYANSTILPYEKRYFAGGANGVRGWSVRSLGPGSYKSSDGKVNFINQTGNLKLDLSLEWRTRLFWKFDGAVFVDAGNIWNTRAYDDQPGGLFKFNSFYKEIAVAYGVGIRLDFNYFILRFDGGMKAINPAEPSGRGHYPIIHPRFSRDFTFHFAVGLPF